MAKRSPGPWTRGSDTSDGFYIYDAKGKMVAHISYQSSDLIERENARLIAAAPELLLACHEALARIESDIEGRHTVAEGDLCREAISKALRVPLAEQ